MTVATAPASRQHAFLTALPAVERHARGSFRRVRCPHARADLVAETVGLVWAWFAAVAAAPRAAAVHEAAARAARAVRAGRRLTDLAVPA